MRVADGGWMAWMRGEEGLGGRLGQDIKQFHNSRRSKGLHLGRWEWGCLSYIERGQRAMGTQELGGNTKEGRMGHQSIGGGGRLLLLQYSIECIWGHLNASKGLRGDILSFVPKWSVVKFLLEHLHLSKYSTFFISNTILALQGRIISKFKDFLLPYLLTVLTGSSIP